MISRTLVLCRALERPAISMSGVASFAVRPAVAHQPGQARFGDPPVTAEALRGLDALAGDPHLDPGSTRD
jgi:hypothetical protein